MSKRLEMFDKLLARGSPDPFHLYARAMELRSLGRLDEAVAAFAEVEQKFPDYVPTFLMAGQLAQELDKLDDARAWFERGLEVARAAGESHTVGELESALEGLAG